MGAYPAIVVAILAIILVGDIVMAVVLGVVKPTASEGLTSDNYTIVVSSEVPSPPSTTAPPPPSTTTPAPTTASPPS